jgi:hypothetical protein
MRIHGRATVLLVSTHIQGTKVDEIDPGQSKVGSPTNRLYFLVPSVFLGQIFIFDSVTLTRLFLNVSMFEVYLYN